MISVIFPPRKQLIEDFLMSFSFVFFFSISLFFKSLANMMIRRFLCCAKFFFRRDLLEASSRGSASSWWTPLHFFFIYYLRVSQTLPASNYSFFSAPCPTHKFFYYKIMLQATGEPFSLKKKKRFKKMLDQKNIKERRYHQSVDEVSL